MALTPRLRVREQDLKDKVAVVTGASKGIGRAIAIHLASRGCSVLGTCSSKETLHLIDSLAHTVSDLYKGLQKYSNGQAPKIVGVAANLLSADCADTITKALEIHFEGHSDIVVFNAAVVLLAAPGEADIATVQDMLLANVQTPYLVVDQLVKKKMFRQNSRIVSISSDVARTTIPGFHAVSLYSAVKAALESFTRTWAEEFGANPQLEFMKGTTVNAVSAGLIDSDLISSYGPEMRQSLETKILPKQSLGATIGKCENVADIVGFLCSHDARWMTGSVVAANGGSRKVG